MSSITNPQLLTDLRKRKMPRRTRITVVETDYVFNTDYAPNVSHPKHYKMMCNVVVNGKRKSRNSQMSKSIVNACASDGIHIANAFGKNGEVWNCFGESRAVRVGDVAHMYHGDMDKGNSKHFVGEILSAYEKFSDVTIEEFPEVKKAWPSDSNHGGPRRGRAIFCRVSWKEVAMTPGEEYRLKWPGKNGFKVQGTILRIR